MKMGTQDRSVLIVEDDQAIAYPLQHGIRVAGYAVSGVASTAEQALTLARRQHPRYAIIDVDLGEGGNGIEVARRLLRDGPVGIIYLTGYPDLVRGADVGAAWMPKPYRLIDLINALEVVGAVSEQRPILAPIPPDLHFLQA
jgi:DNA-binding response OmpR family regulator